MAAGGRREASSGPRDPNTGRFILVQGCYQRKGLDDLDNQDLLCKPHHHAKTKGADTTACARQTR